MRVLTSLQASEDLQDIFDPFRQLGAGHAKTNVGLGLFRLPRYFQGQPVPLAGGTLILFAANPPKTNGGPPASIFTFEWRGY